LTDELEDPKAGTSTGLQNFNNALYPLDERILPAPSAADVLMGVGGRLSYNNLNAFRKLANQAIGALAAYDTVATDTASVRVLRSELYALEGYGEIMLSDLFCSGVPLSTLDFEQDYTLHTGSTTAQVYEDAIAKFDTALVLAAGNDRMTNLARVGRGRAWLNLGQYDSAAAAVKDVPNDFQYQLAGAWYGAGVGPSAATNVLEANAKVSDREGLNGLPYISIADPRSAAIAVSYSGRIQQFPAKYQSVLTGEMSPIIIADGTEAQLIRAEGALHAGDVGTWLTTLNALRTSGVVDSVAWLDTVGVTTGIYGDTGRFVSQHVDTVYNATHTSIAHIYTINTYQRPVWQAGTGGMSGLYPISDPGNDAARVDTMFTERATWLFMTGHRQGDLRRLLREYGPTYPSMSDQAHVYPVGTYTAPGRGIYGNDVTVPIPATEYANPLFHGCLNRDP
jgi:hypothetical protein